MSHYLQAGISYRIAEGQKTGRGEQHKSSDFKEKHTFKIIHLYNTMYVLY